MRSAARTPKKIVRRKKPVVRRIRVITEAPAGQEFFVHNGPILKTLEELAAAIPSMPDEIFEYHTRPRGNDFARWVKEVFGKSRLSEKLEKAATKEEAVKILLL